MHEMTTESPEAYLTAVEVCSLLKITGRTLYRYQDRGLLRPFLLPGGHRRYRRSEVEALLSEAAS